MCTFLNICYTSIRSQLYNIKKYIPIPEKNHVGCIYFRIGRFINFNNVLKEFYMVSLMTKGMALS